MLKNNTSKLMMMIMKILLSPFIFIFSSKENISSGIQTHSLADQSCPNQKCESLFELPTIYQNNHPLITRKSPVRHPMRDKIIKTL